MQTSRITKVLFVVLFVLGSAGTLRANTISIWNFDSDPLGLATTFSETQNGLTATFSSPADPGGFVVASSFFSSLTGNVLFDPGPVGASFIPLTISLSKNAGSIFLNFATDGTGPFTLMAFHNGVLVGTISATGVVPPGFAFPEGTISFGGASFNSVTLFSPATAFFAIDNVTVSTVPEPGTMTLLASGLAGLLGATRRRRRATPSSTP